MRHLRAGVIAFVGALNLMGKEVRPRRSRVCNGASSTRRGIEIESFCHCITKTGKFFPSALQPFSPGKAWNRLHKFMRNLSESLSCTLTSRHFNINLKRWTSFRFCSGPQTPFVVQFFARNEACHLQCAELFTNSMHRSNRVAPLRCGDRAGRL